MDSVKLFAPVFPIWALGPLLAIAAVMMFFSLRNLTGLAARFGLLALWLRILFDAYPAFSFRTIAAGLTFNAVLSIATAGFGLLAVRPRDWALSAMVPIYLLLASVLLTHAIVGAPMELLYQLIKYVYIAVIALAIVEGIRANGRERYCARLAIIGLFLVVLQVAAVGCGLVKLTESDNSAAYVGGFNHEANFSIVLAAFMLPTILATGWRPVTRIGVMAALSAAMLLTNYRTTVLSIAPFVLVYVGMEVLRRFRGSSQGVLVAALALAAVATPLAIQLPLSDRLEAVVQLARDPLGVIQRPDSFTNEERRFASSRGYIWSTYTYAFADAPALQKTIGHGGDSWSQVHDVYPQNTILSFLWEFGVVGAVAVILFWIGLFVLALGAGPWRVPLLTFNLGLLLINMSTQPLWLVEGLILYGMLLGLSLTLVSEQRRARQRVPVPAPAPSVAFPERLAAT